MEELGIDHDFEEESPVVSTTLLTGFDDFYIIHADSALSTLKLQMEEVEAVRWATHEEVMALLTQGRFIPYSRPFLEYVFFRWNHPGNFDTGI